MIHLRTRALPLALLVAFGSACSTEITTTPGGEDAGTTSGTGGAAGSGGGTSSGGSGGTGSDPDATSDTRVDATLGDADDTKDAITVDVDPDVSNPGCEAVTMEQVTEGSAHVPVCSPVTYGTNPPSSGSHYPVWAAYRTYTKTFPRGFWVHSLEHGAVVITYNCPDGCAAEVAAAQALIDSLPPDSCGVGQRRIILLPDPDLDTRFAASAWGFTLRAKCFDRTAFASFIDSHTDHGPESVCGGGEDPNGGDSGTPICQ